MTSKENQKIKLTVLGCRGSMAVSGKDKMIYGCASSSYLFEAAGERIFLDAGTGIINAPSSENEKISLLITHPHIDHVLGFPFFLAANKGKEIDVYGENRNGLDIRHQLEIYLSEPLWPATMEMYPVDIRFKAISGGEEGACFNIGGVTISTMQSEHPGGSTIFSLSCENKKVIYATDFEHEEKAFNRLKAFSEDADLVLYDAQYTAKEYDKCKGYGHSTYEKGLELMKEAGIKKMLLVHHEPKHSDAFMEELSTELKKRSEGLDISFAKESDEVFL